MGADPGHPDEPTITDAMSLALGALALMGLSIFGPGIATGLVSGAPQLSAGAAVGTGLAVAGMGAAGYMGGRAAAQPVRAAMSRAGDAMRSSYRSGQAGAWTATGGQSPVAGMGGGAGSAAAAASSASEQPAWAARMKRGQTMSHGATAAAHAVRSGDSGGGSMNVSLQQDDRK
ncbi:hypothetical protein [Afifella pfennigii]|uniref:hypothetical protein n=1 Tax=Afifella pfennigii TaxID=209897 RepID=UPI000478B93D|nr:hypothetical protein [Afifella pfennigii]